MNRRGAGALCGLLLAAPAGAAVTPGRIEGSGTVGAWSVRGDVAIGADGAQGSFDVTTRSAECRLDRIERAGLLANEGIVDAEGTCVVNGRAVPAAARVAVNDNEGRPDEVEVRFSRPEGLGLRRSSLDGGDFRVEAEAPRDPQIAAMARLRETSRTRPEISIDAGFPRTVVAELPATGEDAVAQARGFLDAWRDLYRIGPETRLGVLRRVAERGLPGEVVHFYQTWHGIPVQDADIGVFLRDGVVYGTVGALLTRGPADEAAPPMDAERAEDIARRQVEPFGADVVGRTTLVVFDPAVIEGGGASEPRLAWRVTLGGGRPSQVLVDAHDGRVLRSVTLGNGDYELDLETVNNQTDAASSGCYWNTWADDHIGDQDAITEPAFQNDPDAIGAFDGFAAAYDYYFDNFSRDSYDGDGNESEVFVHVALTDKNGQPTTNAQYNSCQIGLCVDEMFEFSDGTPVGDVITHEFTHGVTDHESGLGGFGLPGAANESLSDIQAFIHTGDPIIGEGSGLGCRDIAVPASGKCGNLPDRLSEKADPTALGSDNGNVHFNSGITSKAAFLVARGGVHPDNLVPVQGVGDDLAGYLFYEADLKMPSNGGPSSMRAAILATVTMSGYDAQVRCSVENAFGAVEVGSSDVNCDGVLEDPTDFDGDTFPNTSDNCPGVANPDQADMDHDNLGDVCDPDMDGDGVDQLPTPPNLTGDNCPTVYNPDQKDFDFDGTGAACDPDEDGDIDDDGVPDATDDCPWDANPPTGGVQADADADGEGDACDPDLDSDGISNDQDNCVNVPNNDQADSDHDLLGDACDPCPKEPNSGVAWGYFKDPITGEVTVKPVVGSGCGKGGIGGASAIIDGSAAGPWPAVNPDGQPHDMVVSGDGGQFVQLPVPVCLGRDCDLAPASDGCIEYDFGDLDAEVYAAIADETGKVVAHAPIHRKQRVLRLQPRGGHDYTLQLALSPWFRGETELSVTATPCRVGDRSEQRPVVLPEPGDR